MPTADERLQALNLTLPPAPEPYGLYRPCLRVGDFLYLSGHGPRRDDGTTITGVVGRELSFAQGVDAARQVGLSVLSTVIAHCGSLAKVRRVVKTLGWVACVDGFADQPLVMNGFSELMREVFGPEAGVGVRSAVGTNALPGNMAVEVEVLFELHAG